MLDGIPELLALDLKKRSYSDRAVTAWIAARGLRFYLRSEEYGKAMQLAELLNKFHDDKSKLIRRLVSDAELLVNETLGVA